MNSAEKSKGIWAAATEKVEPEAQDLASNEDRCMMSIAISLRRIADALDGTSMGVNIRESLAGFPWAAINGQIPR